MLSRVADSMFWMSRYLERSKLETNFLVTQNRAIQDNALPDEWSNIVSKFSSDQTPPLNLYYNDKILSFEAISYLVFDKNNSFSIYNNIHNIRENARSIQDHLSKEMWTHINDMYHNIKSDHVQQLLAQHDYVDLLHSILDDCLILYGIVDDKMERNSGYYFLKIGKYFERIYQSINLLQLKLENINYNLQDQSVLGFRYLLLTLSGFEYFGKRYKGFLTLNNVIQYILFEPLFAHSILYSLQRLQNNFKSLRYDSTPQSFKLIEFQIGKIINNFVYHEETLENGEELKRFLNKIQTEINILSTQFSHQYFGQKYYQ